MTVSWSTLDVRWSYFRIGPGCFPQDVRSTPSKSPCIPGTADPGPTSDMLIGFENPHNYCIQQTDLSPIGSFIPPRSGLLPFRKDDNEFWLTQFSQTPTVHESILEDLDHFPRIMFTFFPDSMAKGTAPVALLYWSISLDARVNRSGVGEPASNEYAKLYSGWTQRHLVWHISLMQR